MRFKRILPATGTFQERIKFALLPTAIKSKDEDGKRVDTIVWLERYRTMYHYTYGSWGELRHERKVL